ncbi:nucleoside deaminase [Solitalea sp. MAHUQ-68]|uniref:Nucleoside deaminase n=1 Tax=Solitalea agri TaxID=2953739 RepID=A0A9X2JF95_9SPHI|nr:nucleoside deaminase [Solitalea agri]MCO4294760.1 nucleoside deaminase [Solitalea agri]
MGKLENEFMLEAIRLSKEGLMNNEGGPFGCVIVKDGKIIGKGNNQVLATNDPTAHAEVVAIREACKTLGSFQLEGCELYTSCEPCPMCLGAIYWARPQKVYYANTREDAAKIGFDDDFIYQEIPLSLSERHIPMLPMGREQALEVFKFWAEKGNKSLY